jgi:predicted transposase/invertase (TIGR01784 family)
MESEKTMQKHDRERAAIEEAASLTIPQLVEKLRQCDANPVMSDMDMRHREFLFWQLMGLRRAYREGFEQGDFNRRIETASRMKVKRYPVKEIAEITELSEKEIEKLI